MLAMPEDKILLSLSPLGLELQELLGSIQAGLEHQNGIVARGLRLFITPHLQGISRDTHSLS